MKGNKKGILLTLVTIVLLVLMIAELVTYVYLTINYETVSSFGSLSIGGYRLATTINSGTAAFLHVSLASAIKTLASYESVGNRKGAYFINNTAFALQSLMTNGTVYGTNELTLMGGSTLVNYTNAIIRQARFQNLNLTITNSSLQIYQTNPYYLNATYTGLATINSSSGIFAYPISVSSGIALNGTPDLYSVQNNDNYVLKLTNKYAPATLVGNVYATSGSRSRFQFAYGTVIVENGIASCAAIPAQFKNGNYILAVPDDSAFGSCSMAGVITYTPTASAYTVPYLVYNSGSNVINDLYNGTSVLINGAGLALLNLSQLQGAIQGGYYSGSSYAPSYLDWSQSNITKRSQAGLFSLNLYNRLVPSFTPATSTYIKANAIFATTNSHVSISLWFSPKNFIQQYSGIALANEGGSAAAGNVLEVALAGSKILFGSQVGGCNSINSISINSILPNTWHNVVAVFNKTGANAIYLDGNPVGSGALTLCNQNNNGFFIGTGSGGSFNGAIANLQTYNISLTPLQASNLYYEGIDGIAISPRNLTGWWPLDGNSNDNSGKGNTGNAVSTTGNGISYRYLYNYPGDPIYGGSLNGNLTNIVQGVINCANLSQCSNNTLQHLYLGPTSLSVTSGIAQTAANTLGLSNAVIPNVGIFNGQNGFVQIPNAAQLQLSSLTMSGWVYYTGPAIGGYDWLIAKQFAWGVGACGNSLNVCYFDWGGTGEHDSGVLLNKNTWYFLAATVNGGTETVYVNGVQVESNPLAISSQGTGIQIGYGNAAGQLLNGSAADIQIYNTPLSGAQINQLYLNDNVIGVNAIDAWPLSGWYNGYMNQTVDSVNSLNPGLLENTQALCTNANIVTNTCGVYISQP